METVEFAIIGAGIAGASIAWQLAEKTGVLLIEREAQPGYHTTGRSAALFMESYGTPNIQALTRASRAFCEAPPEGFAPEPILTPRGVVYVATQAQLPLLDAACAQARAQSTPVQRLEHAALMALLPCLRANVVAAGLHEPEAADIDVHALHQGYLRGLRQRGGLIQTHAEVVKISRADGLWTLTLDTGEALTARHIVNAAGAWADEVARMAGVPPIGLTPYRRTAFTFAAPEGLDTSCWPAVIGMDESFYFKPDAGQLLGSPANTDPTHPHDVAPEELDVATAIHHIEQITTLEIRRPTRTWAGLRSFVDDGDMVIGWDNHVAGFFWLAAQGGCGIQSAAGAGLLACNLVLGEPVAAELVLQGVDVAGLSPQRLR